MRRPTPRPAAEGSAVRPCGRPRSWSSPDQIASPGAISSVPCWFAQYSVRQRYLLGTPGGGGVDHGESINDAARRELYEKTGIQIDDVGVCVAVVDGAFTFNGRDYRQREYVFSVRVQESFCRPPGTRYRTQPLPGRATRTPDPSSQVAVKVVPSPGVRRQEKPLVWMEVQE